MKTVNVHEAKTTLSALLAEVEKGEDVVIARNGTPVARLTRVGRPVARRQGAWRDDPAWAAFTFDPAIFAPMDDDALRDEGWAP